MALINVTNVIVMDNPSQFTNPFQFEITFECLEPLQEDLEWRVLYVGSAESSQYDQVLEEVVVGPVPVGHHKFVLEADPPNVSLLKENALGVTVVLITCSFLEHEFVRIGYYVHNEWCLQDPLTGEMRAVSLEGHELPDPLPWHQVTRTVLSDKPRVTRFGIPWRKEEAPLASPQQHNKRESRMVTPPSTSNINSCNVNNSNSSNNNNDTSTKTLQTEMELELCEQ